MRAEIITIGDEILIGQIVDSNSAYIGKALNKIGVSVHQISSIQDDKLHILTALKEAESRADIIIITGGLGPTKDDITKLTLCEYFNDELIENTKVLEHVEELLSQLNVPINKLNVMQALVPSKAEVLHNSNGTAPGMWFYNNGKAIISLPGVPYEMKAILKDEVIPRLTSQFNMPYIQHKTVITQGIAESVLAEQISEWENALPNVLSLAYLPSLGVVRLRLSATGDNKDDVERVINSELHKLKKLLGEAIIGYDEATPETALKKLLIAKKQTLAVAESCTGGFIASCLTQNEGVSPFFKGGMVTYQTETKSSVLGLDASVIAYNSVVSEVVACEMALKIKEQFKSDYAIATTGNAGPTKGDSDAEIGTVFIAIASPEKVIVEEFNFGTNRFRVIQRAKNKAFELLIKEITNAK
ncbi:MAG: CinA family nicotinamide mononucleotide deamidase-related protein [Flavobacteriaceae bacterium]